MNRKETKMSAICEQHLPTLKKLIKYLNTGANSWTKIADAHNLPEIDIIEIDGATIYSGIVKTKSWEVSASNIWVKICAKL